MSDEIKPLSLLCMWQLFTCGGETLLKDMRPKYKPECRRPLVDGGLIEETPAGRSKKLTLTDAGWHYLDTHMTDSINAHAAAASANVLQGVLDVLHSYMRRTGVTLAELSSQKARNDGSCFQLGEAGFQPVEIEHSAGEEHPIQNMSRNDFDADALWHRLLRSWNRLQEADDGIRLEKLRAAFGDVQRAELDSALLELQTRGKIVIYHYDDGERVTPEVKEAALRVNGRELHIIYKK